MARAVSAKRQAGSAFGTLEHQVADHGHELGVSAYCRGANHRDAKRLAYVSSFRIEIVDHFHMVGEKTDGNNDHSGRGNELL